MAEPRESESSDSSDVLEVIRARASGRPDRYRLGLALEGGGMRGVVSGAMLLALRDLGIMPAFDALYGTSSGSVNLAYFAAGGSWEALSLYYDHLPRGFVRRRSLPHQPRLDMEFVFDRLMQTVAPLDTERLRQSEYDIRIVLSDVDALAPVTVKGREVAADIRTYLKAGSWLPFLAGRPFPFNGRRYLDGGLLWPDPLYAALADGCTHILMLNTAPDGAPPATSPVTSAALGWALERWAPGLGDAYRRWQRRWNADQQVLRTGGTVRLRGTAVARIRPAPGSHAVGRLTMDRGALLDGARVGYGTVMEAFGRPLRGAHFQVAGGPV